MTTTLQRRLDRLIDATSVRPQTAYRMREALIQHFLGRGSVKQCIENTSGISESTFYRIRKDHPGLAEAIDNTARGEALYRVDGKTIAYQARQKRLSHEVQERAIEALLDPRVIQAILDIALGKPRQVEVAGETVTMIVYPRDQLKAIALLQDLARGGVLPETHTSFTDILPAMPKKPTRGKKPTTLESIGVRGSLTDSVGVMTDHCRLAVD